MRRGRIDYRMRRRALLAAVAAGERYVDEVRDAHPDLLRAATHLGATSGDDCPLCAEELVHVTYVFDDDRVRHPGGRAVPPGSLAAHVARAGELQVYVVEVCAACHWHHLVESYFAVGDDRASTG